MKNIIKKLTGLAVLTALLGMPLTHAIASDTMDEMQEMASDSWITSKVKSVFLADSELSVFHIRVETDDGVVMLSGQVKTDEERDLAIRKAKEIEGVKSVTASGLKVAE